MLLQQSSPSISGESMDKDSRYPCSGEGGGGPNPNFLETGTLDTRSEIQMPHFYT